MGTITRPTTGIVPSHTLAADCGLGEYSSNESRPTWWKNASKIYVVVYPSNETSTELLSDPSKPMHSTEGAGYGIFVEPKKMSKTRLWKAKNSQPTLFTVENGISGSGFMIREGARWGVNGMLIRFLIDSKDEAGKVDEVHRVLSQIAVRARAGDVIWLREALLALSGAGLIRHFFVDEFIDLAKRVVRNQLGIGAHRSMVVTVNYEDHITKEQSCIA